MITFYRLRLIIIIKVLFIVLNHARLEERSWLQNSTIYNKFIIKII